MSEKLTLTTAGGRIQCTQCQAKSKRTGVQCRAPAAKNKTKCRFHGGASTGPKTPEGRQRCAAVKTIHGNETTEKRLERSLASARFATLEWAGHLLGFMHGARTRGRKPGLIGEVELALRQVVRDVVLRQTVKK